MEMKSVRPEGRQLIESYGSGGFRVSGTRHQGSIIVTRDLTQGWDVADIAGLTPEACAPLMGLAAELDIVLLGCGSLPLLPDRELQKVLADNGLKVDMMTTAAACRTYNILAGEDRRVAAALIAID